MENKRRLKDIVRKATINKLVVFITEYKKLRKH